MSPISDPSAQARSSRLWLAWGLCVLALGLFGWRSVAIFSTPPETLSQHPLAEIVTTITGPGNSKISETASGDVLILLNGPAGTIDPSISSRLTDIGQTIDPDGAAPILKQFPFAAQTGSRPTNAELVELFLLGLFPVLTFFLAFSSPHEDTDRTPALPADRAFAELMEGAAPPPFDTAPTLTPIAGAVGQQQQHSVADAKRFAEANPDVTAKTIERWIRARGFIE